MISPAELIAEMKAGNREYAKANRALADLRQEVKEEGAVGLKRRDDAMAALLRELCAEIIANAGPKLREAAATCSLTLNYSDYHGEIILAVHPSAKPSLDLSDKPREVLALLEQADG